eukprot:TRINITY_DN4857_c0_g1_i2.p1 TRINITY_DN4857_c0_g1~~TRINITY_DN4857_c0_g1_i2.p1  ORF type:complete len:205 (-),score=50.76 TRINITY_DN4857_c0_g1_i2:185-766(-)
MQAPMLVLNASTKRESGRKAQLGNIAASKAVADVIRTTLGPRSMLKMLLDATGGIVLTNDGHAILREIDVTHPAAKTMIEISRTQDEEVGDGTTSVIILAGELLHVAEPFLEKNFHPTVLCRAYARALEDAIKVIDKIAFPLDVNSRVGAIRSEGADNQDGHRDGVHAAANRRHRERHHKEERSRGRANAATD